MLSRFSNCYRRDYDRYKQDSGPSAAKEASIRRQGSLTAAPEDIWKRLDGFAMAMFTSPLSDTVTSLFDHHKDRTLATQSAHSLSESLKLIFRNSERLYEFPLRGAVFKYGDEIVAKVVRRTSDTTEYTTLQYLADHAPDFPAPKPHGCVGMSPFEVIFMSDIPSRTLTDVWPTLTRDQKVSIQHQLDRMLLRLRQLKQPDGYALGGVGGQGVNDMHREDYRSEQVIASRADFDDRKIWFLIL